ncbi:hypothetical protein DL96DRAFT_1812791 [Flagelloscypha sp. PMI_526]|nr:hypothetical protein DL96DRAFT_1812791 [Flagelloscypha sp. PMI_526]
MADLLSSDLYHEIFDYLFPPSLRACSLTNSSFRDIAQPKLFSHITITFVTKETWRETNSHIYHPRGLALCKQAKGLALCSQVAEQTDDDLREVIALLQSFSHRLGTLELRGAGTGRSWNQAFMSALRLHVLPFLQCLVIRDVAIPFFDLITNCTTLKVLQIHTNFWHGPLTVEGNQNLADATLPQIKRLILLSRNGDVPLQHNQIGAYLSSQQSSIRYLLWGHMRSEISFEVLQPYTALVELSFERTVYEALVKQKRPGHLRIPIQEFPCLQHLAFSIGSPNRPDWPSFFSWVGLHFTSHSPSLLRDISFSFPCPPLSDRVTTRSAPPGKSQFLLQFDSMARRSLFRLIFVLQTTFDEGYRLQSEQIRYAVSVVKVKEWLASWDEAGKLDIRREWLK